MLVLTSCSAVLSIAAASAVLRRQPVRRVSIVGGTHGNELLGVQLVGMLQQRPEETRRPSFESMCVLANPEAVRQNSRYVTVDLNRCFSNEACPTTTTLNLTLTLTLTLTLSLALTLSLSLTLTLTPTLIRRWQRSLATASRGGGRRSWTP